MNELRDVGALIGRILVAVIFVLSGFGKIMGFTRTEVMMAAQGIPATEILLILAILIELGGGLLIIVGFQARWAALAIFLFMIPVTWIFHVQGYMHAAQQHQMQMAMMQQINILKNVSIEGGLLLIASFGPGRYSVDSAL
jgi:putative oxidoreductase